MKRIRLQRKKGWWLPDGAKSVAYATRWQNPHRKARPLDEAVRLFQALNVRQASVPNDDDDGDDDDDDDDESKKGFFNRFRRK